MYHWHGFASRTVSHWQWIGFHIGWPRGNDQTMPIVDDAGTESSTFDIASLSWWLTNSQSGNCSNGGLVGPCKIPGLTG